MNLSIFQNFLLVCLCPFLFSLLSCECNHLVDNISLICFHNELLPGCLLVQCPLSSGCDFFSYIYVAGNCKLFRRYFCKDQKCNWIEKASVAGVAATSSEVIYLSLCQIGFFNAICWPPPPCFLLPDSLPSPNVCLGEFYQLNLTKSKYFGSISSLNFDILSFCFSGSDNY